METQLCFQELSTLVGGVSLPELGVYCKRDNSAYASPTQSVCLERGLAPPQPGHSVAHLCGAVQTPQRPKSALTLLPLSLGTAMGSFGSSVPLPLVPSPD